MTEAQIQIMVTKARSLIGVPFFHAGRTERGLDCVGLIMLAAHAASIDVPNPGEYSQVVNGGYMQSRLMEFCDKVTDGNVHIGDIALFMIGTSPQHIGLITSVDPLAMVHSYQSAGKVVEHAFDAPWRRRLIGMYRWRQA